MGPLYDFGPDCLHAVFLLRVDGNFIGCSQYFVWNSEISRPAIQLSCENYAGTSINRYIMDDFHIKEFESVYDGWMIMVLFILNAFSR